jgi:hypothetical protein
MVFGFLFGWRHRVGKLRKRWDRLREKSLKKDQPFRGRLLEKLDIIENNLKTLEEQQLTRVNRAKIAKQVEIELEEVKELLKGEVRGETVQKTEEMKEKSRANF